MENLKRNVKDSVFTYLFSFPEYTRELYQCLHPEDSDIQEKDIELVTLHHIITNGIYNDLGFKAKNRTIFLVEAQSTSCPNMPLRMLMYLAKTYQQEISSNPGKLYSSTKVRISLPQLYIIYSGEENMKNPIRFSELFEDGEKSDVEVTVHVRGQQEGDNIIGQYVRFAQISDTMRLKYQNDPARAAGETVEYCIAHGILKRFMMDRRKEIENIMITLFDQQKITESFGEDKKEEGRLEGKREGMLEGKRENQIDTALSMLRDGSLPFEKIAQYTGLTVAEVEELSKKHSA